MLISSKAATSILLRTMIAGILIGSGVAACGKTEDPLALMADARRYEEKDNHNAAIIQIKNVLQQNPDDAEARYFLGTIYNKTGDAASAEKEFRKALSLGMSPAKVMPELGQTLLNLGQFQQILDETEQLAGDGKSAEILTLRGNALLAVGKVEEAQGLFEQALRIRQNFSSALIGLGKYSALKGDIDNGMHFSEQATMHNPEDADAWLFKGDLLRAQGKVDLALAAYDQVVKLKPNSSPAYLNKAFLEIGAKKFDTAKTSIDAARKVAPNSLMVLYTQAMLDFNQGNPAAALESLQQVLRSAPNHMPSVLMAGAVQIALGSPIQAEEHLKRYLEGDPENLYARKLLGSVLLKNHRTQQAIAVLNPALRAVHEDAHLLALAGESYMQAKDFAKATEYFERASKVAPQNAMLHTALSMSRLGQGDSERAIAELEKATQADPQSPQAAILLIMTHLRLNEFDKALATANAFEKDHPDNPIVKNLKGGAYLAKKDTANARVSFEKALAIQPNYFPAVANLAQLDLQEKKPGSAKKRLEAFLEKDEKNIQAMNALSNLALRQGQIKEATAWLERASRENPEALQPSLRLGAHYIRTGEKEKSLALAKKLRSVHSDDSGVLELLAYAQFANNDKDGALESYTKLARARPDYAPVQFRIASLQLAMNNLSAASDALKKALAIKPDYLDAQLAMVALEAGQKDHEKALSLARQIQKQHQKLPAGYVAEGDILLGQKNPSLAAKAYEHAFSIDRNPAYLVKLHNALTQADRGAEATPRLIQWLKDHPDDTSTRMYLAEVYLVDNQNKPAIDQYHLVLQQHPEHVPALNNLATAYQKEQDARALEYAEKAHKLAPENAAILDTLGWIWVERGNTAKGLPLLQKATSLAPGAGDIRYHLAAGLAKSGDRAAARKELEQLLGTEKSFSSIEKARVLLKELQ